MALSPALPLQTMSTTAPVGTVDAAAPARYINVSTARFRAGTDNRVGGPHPPSFVPSLFCAPGDGPLPCLFYFAVSAGLRPAASFIQRTAFLPHRHAFVSQSAPSVVSIPFCWHPIRGCAAFSGVFCSNPCPFPSGWRMALLGSPPQ